MCRQLPHSTPTSHAIERKVVGQRRYQSLGFKVPKLVTFQAEMPREDTGKIFKRKLREPYWAGLARRI